MKNLIHYSYKLHINNALAKIMLFAAFHHSISIIFEGAVED
jgi:hypothetical protein